jgi:hypothetical protein
MGNVDPQDGPLAIHFDANLMTEMEDVIENLNDIKCITFNE